jgi:hypothetical protein
MIKFHQTAMKGLHLKKVVSLINHKDSFEEAKNNSADILIE